MSVVAEFVVPGPPVGKGRPRIGRVAGHARMFTPEKTMAYESLVRHCAALAMAGRTPVDAACRVDMTVTMAIPASWPKKRQQQAASGAVFPTTKPDADNVLKAVCDAINGVVWRDDVQAVEVRVGKRYGAVPQVQVAISTMEPAA